jgi:hypothetical protein
MRQLPAADEATQRLLCPLLVVRFYVTSDRQWNSSIENSVGSRLSVRSLLHNVSRQHGTTDRRFSGKSMITLQDIFQPLTVLAVKAHTTLGEHANRQCTDLSIATVNHQFSQDVRMSHNKTNSIPDGRIGRLDP